MKSRLQYWLLLSEWKKRPDSGRRLDQIILSTSITRPLLHIVLGSHAPTLNLRTIQIRCNRQIVLVLSAVTTNLHFPYALTPCSFISRRARLFQTHTLLTWSSLQIPGQPYSPYVNKQGNIAEALAGNHRTIRNSSSLMFKVTAGTDIEYFALSDSRPTAFVSFNSGVLHSDSRAKYSVAFLECRAPSSPLQALTSGASFPFVPRLPAPANFPFATCLTQFSNIWLGIPSTLVVACIIDRPEPIIPLSIYIPAYTMLSWLFLLSFLRLLSL